MVDRPNLGQKRPLRSKGHHHNLPDKTRTVAGVVINPANFSGLIRENISQWVGIDISKATLDVYLRPLGKAMKVNNTEEDISKLVETLKYYTVNLIVLEATGG